MRQRLLMYPVRLRRLRCPSLSMLPRASRSPAAFRLEAGPVCGSQTVWTGRNRRKIPRFFVLIVRLLSPLSAADPDWPECQAAGRPDERLRRWTMLFAFLESRGSPASPLRKVRLLLLPQCLLSTRFLLSAAGPLFLPPLSGPLFLLPLSGLRFLPPLSGPGC